MRYNSCIAASLLLICILMAGVPGTGAEESSKDRLARCGEVCQHPGRQQHGLFCPSVQSDSDEDDS
jgi:hypothetical protein